MIFGIGTDVVEVARIEDSILRFGSDFARKILSEAEMQEYHQLNAQSPQPARFLAKRFAAKEAFAKALGTGIRAPATFTNIAIAHDDMGKPVFNLATELLDFLNTKGIHYTHLSISDEKSLAAAFVVLEKGQHD